MLRNVFANCKCNSDVENDDPSYDNNNVDFEQKLIIRDETNFKNEIKQAIKYIEDTNNVEDYIIINFIDNLVRTTYDGRKCFECSQTGYDNFSLLHYAAKSCRVVLCEYLIDELQIDVDVLSKSKMTPLHVLIKSNVFVKASNRPVAACLNFVDTNRMNFINTFGLLIQKGTHFNIQDENGYTPLHHAALVNNYEATFMLINLKNINFLIEDESNLTALHLACKYGFEDLACLIVEKTNIENLINSKNSPTLPIHLACKNKEEPLAVVKRILDRLKLESPTDLKNVLIKLDSNKQNLLNIAIDNNHLNIVDMLLKDFYNQDVDLEDKHGNLPIHLAAKSGSTDVLKILFKNNAFSSKGNLVNENPVHIAAANNKYKFIKEFLSFERKFIEKTSPKDYTSSVRCVNLKKQTPLFLAIINGHTKCVELFSNMDNIDLDAKDIDGNSIYHMCAKYNNFESLRFLLNRKDSKFLEPLYIKNNQEETVIHTACKHENLEIIKLVLSKIYDGFISTEIYLLSKNREGKTFFHIACIKGYFNIVEYFLRDLKMMYFIEHQDNELNQAIHLASLNGHLSIVNLLLDLGADINAKNKDENSALELSCQKGFFEISKVLISRYSKISNNGESSTNSDDPLVVACHEGAHEVVKLLLLKGAAIDTLNNESKNCLDIAIEQGHRDVIRVLLKNENWHKLFYTKLEDEKSTMVNYPSDFEEKLAEHSHRNAENLKKIYKKENPQLNAMFDKKMWDMIKIVLDNCKNGNDYDFTKLDPRFKNINAHPLMLLAKSGQETLIKHETTKMLLNLKWRFTPRFVFYFNIFFYLFYLMLYSYYCVQLSNIFENQIDVHHSNNQSYEYKMDLLESNRVKFDSLVEFHLIIIFILNLVKKIFQILLIEKFTFFLSIPNWVELSTYVFAFVSVISPDVRIKFTFAPIAILLSYIEFSFLIQKFKVFGLYVLAFKRTLKNSAKFFPMFLLIYIGFILSFRLRSHFNLTYLNTSSSSYIIKILTMAVGELETNDMGLDEGLFVNYLIYTLFISIMCVIVLNLFVGIAVGEISTVLDEADIQQISMRIIFVLKCQESLRPFAELPILRRLNIRFEKYSYDRENSLIRSKDNIFQYLRETCTSKEPIIKLADPQKRLEDNLTELARITNDDLKSVKEILTNQISDVASKLSNSQQRLEDSFLESAVKNVNNIELTREDTASHLRSVETNLLASQRKIEILLEGLCQRTDARLVSIKQSFCDRFSKLEKNVNSSLDNLQKLVNCLFNKTNQIGLTSIEQFKILNQLNATQNREIGDIQNQIVKINKTLNEILANQCGHQQKPAVSVKRDNLKRSDIFTEFSSSEYITKTTCELDRGLKYKIVEDQLIEEISTITK